MAGRRRSKDPGAGAARRRGRGRRLLGVLLIGGGLLLVLDAALTVLWQEPVSWGYARIQQARLDDRLAERPVLAPAEQRVVAGMEPPRRLPFHARAHARRTREGEPLGRLRMPRLGESSVFVAGTDAGALRRGPGHYPATPLPGARGTVAIAGHRTTYGAPFRRLDELRAGDRLVVEMPYGDFTYVVERTRIVAPTALWVTRRVRHDRLVLTACHPLYSAAQRIVVFARLTREEPDPRA